MSGGPVKVLAKHLTVIGSVRSNSYNENSVSFNFIDEILVKIGSITPYPNAIL